MGERGFSIISILIGIALVSMTVVYFQSSKLSMIKARSFVRGNNEYVPVQNALRERVGEIVSRALFEDCDEQVQLAFMKTTLMQSGGSKVDLMPILGPIDPTVKKQKTVLEFIGDNIPTRFSEAVKRCESPYIDSNQEKYYFCLRFPKTKIIKQPLFQHVGSTIFDGKGRGGFAEYAVQFMNLRTNLPITCSDWKSNLKESGLIILYTMYWQSGPENRPSYHYMNGLHFKGSR